MRRIARIQQPSAALTKCLHAQPTHSVRPGVAAVAATSCLASRPRAFSTTPTRSGHPTHPRLADQASTTSLETAAESQSSLQPTPARAVAPQTIATDLVLPPRKVTTAPRPDDLESTDYVEANSAAGLPVVGGLKGWFAAEEDAGNDHWGPSKSFAGFASEAGDMHPAQLEVCVRRAVLEALAIRSAGDEELLVESWRADGGWERVLGLEVQVNGEGEATVKGDVSGVVEGLVGDVGAREETMAVDEARELVVVTNTDWKLIPLKDAKLKFAVCSPFPHSFYMCSLLSSRKKKKKKKKGQRRDEADTTTIYRSPSASSNSPAMQSPTPNCSTRTPLAPSSRQSSSRRQRARSTRRSSGAAS